MPGGFTFSFVHLFFYNLQLRGQNVYNSMFIRRIVNGYNFWDLKYVHLLILKFIRKKSSKWQKKVYPRLLFVRFVLPSNIHWSTCFNTNLNSLISFSARPSNWCLQLRLTSYVGMNLYIKTWFWAKARKGLESWVPNSWNHILT